MIGLVAVLALAAFVAAMGQGVVIVPQNLAYAHD